MDPEDSPKCFLKKSYMGISRSSPLKLGYFPKIPEKSQNSRKSAKSAKNAKHPKVGHIEFRITIFLPCTNIFKSKHMFESIEKIGQNVL